MDHELFAHSLPDRPTHEWERLIVHSQNVGAVADAFGARFGAGAAARLAGYLHDAGKASDAFQAYIRGSASSTDHSTAGAKIAEQLFDGPMDRIVARLVAFAIAGHHAGLSDGTDLTARLRKPVADYAAWRAATPSLPAGIVPRLGGPTSSSQGYRLAFLGRMIFSCLVDADFLATKRFYGEVARGGHATLSVLRDRLDAHLARFVGASGEVNEHRARILATARARAALEPGLFTMSVPTGGGKTLASLAFALDHAVRHGLERIVYVIP